MNEKDFYNKIKDWNFKDIKYSVENLTKWDMFDVINKYATFQSKILDLGTGGGERVLDYFPDCEEILATDFAEEMIQTANINLKISGRKNITFRVMDNLQMDVPDEYFDIIVARHTCIDAKQIYKALKKDGKLIVRGVDQLDCWSLKRMFGTGQAYTDPKAISVIDYENILDAGFKHVELIPIHAREYYQTKEDLAALLMKTPILLNFSETEENVEMSSALDLNTLDKYIEENLINKGVLLIRRYYGIVASK